MIENLKRSITMSADTVVDGKKVASHSAKIDSDDPKDLVINFWPIDKELYKEHRKEFYKDKEEFENAVYEEQDKMIEANKTAE